MQRADEALDALRQRGWDALDVQRGGGQTVWQGDVESVMGDGLRQQADGFPLMEQPGGDGFQGGPALAGVVFEASAGCVVAVGGDAVEVPPANGCGRVGRRDAEAVQLTVVGRDGHAREAHALA